MKCLVTVERLPWALAVVALAMTAACSRPAEPAVPAAPPPTAPATAAVTPTPADPPSSEPEPSEAPTDPYAIPDVIDKAYVESVLEALGRLYAEAVAEFAREERVTRRTRELVGAAYAPTAAEETLASLRKTLRAQGSDFFNPDAERLRYTVTKLISADSKCIFLVADVDSSDLVVRPRADQVTEYFWLESAPPSNRLNPSPWWIVAEQNPPSGGKEYNDPCAA